MARRQPERDRETVRRLWAPDPDHRQHEPPDPSARDVRHRDHGHQRQHHLPFLGGMDGRHHGQRRHDEAVHLHHRRETRDSGSEHHCRAGEDRFVPRLRSVSDGGRHRLRLPAGRRRPHREQPGSQHAALHFRSHRPRDPLQYRARPASVHRQRRRDARHRFGRGRDLLQPSPGPVHRPQPCGHQQQPHADRHACDGSDRHFDDHRAGERRHQHSEGHVPLDGGHDPEHSSDPHRHSQPDHQQGLGPGAGQFHRG